jgi:shikimate kinase
VGKKLSERLKLRFYDTDEIIIEKAGMSITEIVKKGGWDEFRLREKEAIKELGLNRNCIIATGGGAFETLENREVLKNNSLFIWLSADVKTIVKRMRSDQKSMSHRPSLSHDDLVTECSVILEKREPVYRELADLIIDTSDKGIDKVADEICRFLNQNCLED